MRRTRGAVLVTGASSGIGQACCRSLEERGFHVYAGVRRLPDQKEDGPAIAGKIIPIGLDVTSDASIEQAVIRLQCELREAGLEGLVNCAGAGLSGPLEQLDRAGLNALFDLNVTGQLRVIQAVLPLLRKARGRIVNVGSTSGHIPGAFNGAYSASKFALESITTVLRAELAESHVSVSLVEPGVVATAFWDKLEASENALPAVIPEDVRMRYAHVFARRRLQWATLKASGQSADAVCRAILHVLTAERARRRYVVGGGARIKLAVWRLLPESLRDRIVLRPLRP